jgi:large subunit ribosomal protein L2
MALKTFKPNTPTNRYKQWNSFEEITKHTRSKASLSLFVSPVDVTTPVASPAVTSAVVTTALSSHRLQAQRRDEAAKVIGIEYDPNRSARIALIEYKTAACLHPRSERPRLVHS